MAEKNFREKFFIISGPQESGKSTDINAIYNWLRGKGYDTDKELDHKAGMKSKKGSDSENKDFRCILINEKTNKTVFINSYGDYPGAFKYVHEKLEKYRESTGSDYNITVITASRDIHDIDRVDVRKDRRQALCIELNLSEKDGKFCPTDSESQYVLEYSLGDCVEENLKKVEEIKRILEGEPFNL